MRNQFSDLFRVRRAKPQLYDVRDRSYLAVLITIEYQEFGPGGVIRALVRQNDRKKKCVSVLTVDDVKAAAQALTAPTEA